MKQPETIKSMLDDDINITNKKKAIAEISDLGRATNIHKNSDYHNLIS